MLLPEKRPAKRSPVNSAPYFLAAPRAFSTTVSGSAVSWISSVLVMFVLPARGAAPKIAKIPANRILAGEPVYARSARRLSHRATGVRTNTPERTRVRFCYGAGVPRFVLRHDGRRILLPEGETLIGRSLECRIRFNDPAVSRRHLRIVVESGSAMAWSLGSNGTLLNGVPLGAARLLGDGD